MSSIFDDDSSPPLPPQQPGYAPVQKHGHATQRSSRNRCQPKQISIHDIAAQCLPCDATHRYFGRYGITDTVGWFFNGAEVAGIPCHGAYAAFIHDKDHKAVNILLKVETADGKFEDLFVPGAPIANCWTRINEPTKVKIIAVDTASGLAIAQATGLGVAVVHYYSNLLPVCQEIRAAFPDDSIIIAEGANRAEDQPAAKKIVASAARAIHASIAAPAHGELSFANLNISHGAESIVSCISNAQHLPEEIAAIDDETDSAPVLSWPSEVNAEGLFAAMCVFLSRHTVLSFSAIYAMVLWVVATHLTPIFNTAPVLALLSLTRRCGKSVTLLALSALAYRPELTSETTAAALYEMCDEGLTPFMDEGDQYFKKQANSINAIVNSGYTRIASKVTRKGKKYKTFCFKLIASIGPLTATIMDRSIVIPMFRKSSKEKVERYEAKDNDEATVLRSMIARFVADRRREIQSARPEALVTGNDRAADNWKPLFAIANCAGPRWLKRAHQAAIELTPEDEIPLVLEEFICDMVAIFIRTGADFIPTFDLIEALCKDENKPWATYSRSQQKMSIHDLGKLMREAKVKVGEQKHDANGNRRGYYRRDVEHLFDGYGPSAKSE